ncbi:hypothetical protein, partial [Faecalibacterium sp. DFI.5.82]|uniref:hypothetical protein n=1 Tax=Faecalibacterium sp. DFI.5.82 TaxID=3031725 RepID=UPI0023B02FA5
DVIAMSQYLNYWWPNLPDWLSGIILIVILTLVIVPVLSKAMVFGCAIFSRTLPVLTMIPLREARLIPETMATGAAKISGHGEATTIT